MSQDLLLYKEEGFTRIQNSIELAQSVLANTATSGHQQINDALASLQEQWSIVASKMVETKVNIQTNLYFCVLLCDFFLKYSSCAL